jgi:hypothetical protein
VTTHIQVLMMPNWLLYFFGAMSISMTGGVILMLLLK